ncbi:MAG TPA: YkvA family protein [Dongiaceae bacterium]|jgi:uncharacterized membrane protein YkvA (DUF1232 family)|nr:YkvA family protein [Dongiaceae bacterium]
MPGRELTIFQRDKMHRDQRRVEEGFWRKVRRHAGRLPFMDQLLAAYFCAIDPRTPLQAKAILFGAIAYFVLPFDVIPDFIAGLGYTDDAAVLAAAVRSIFPHIKDDHRSRAKDAMKRIGGA